MKNLFIKDIYLLASNTDIKENFAIKGIQLCTNKGGGQHLSFEIADSTGSINAKWWNRDATHCQSLEIVRYGRVTGRVEDYQKKRSVIVTSVEDLGTPEDCSDFECVAALPLSELTQRLDAHIASIRSPYLASLLTLIFGDNKIRRCFDVAPAAMSQHHACRHGLLQHTVEVTDIAAAIADAQKTWGYARPVERDIVVASTLLHDIGKIYELESAGHDYCFSRRGNLLGHITIGAQLVASKIAKVPGFPRLLSDALLHAIVAHHGKLEWGAAVAPMMPEAQIVHAADLLDAELFYMQEAAEEAHEEFVWQRKLDNRRIFVPSELMAPPVTDSEEVAPIAYVQAMRQAIPILRYAAAGVARSDTSFKTRCLPLLGSVAAGSPLAAEQLIEDQIDVEAEGLPSDPQAFLLRVRGNSMAGDGIVDGDLVVVRPQEHHEPEDIVVALLSGSNDAAIKRVEVRGNEVFLISSNPEFAPIPVPEPADLQVRGRVIARIQREADCD